MDGPAVSFTDADLNAIADALSFACLTIACLGRMRLMARGDLPWGGGRYACGECGAVVWLDEQGCVTIPHAPDAALAWHPAHSNVTGFHCRRCADRAQAVMALSS